MTIAIRLHDLAKRYPLLSVALLAFLAMAAEDCASTVMVVFEAKRPTLATAGIAGSFDVVGWALGLICSALAIESIIREGWRTRRSLTIIAAVSLANFWGTAAGVFLAAFLARH